MWVWIYDMMNIFTHVLTEEISEGLILLPKKRSVERVSVN